MFWLFKPLLSPKTFAKMEVVGTSKHVIKQALLPFIDADNLPKRYGGNAEAF
jgi:phosphatidylinositol transfer protein SFH5